MTWLTTIIPALLGTYKLDASEMPNCTLDVCKTPVVAWAVRYSPDEDNIYTTAHPVTLGYCASHPAGGSPGFYTILHPCGSVEEFPREAAWDTYEDYVKYHEADMKRIKDKSDKN